MPSEVRFAVVRKKLEQHGWVLARISGSHHIFEKPGEADNFSVPVHHQKVMPTYVRKVDKLCSEKPAAEDEGEA